MLRREVLRECTSLSGSYHFSICSKPFLGDLNLFKIDLFTSLWSNLSIKFHAWYSGELAENLQVPRRSLHKHRKVSVAVAVAAVTAGATVVAVTAATAAVKATKVVPPVGDQLWRGFVFRNPVALAPGSTAGASRVAGGTGGHTSVMSRSDALSKSTILPPP